MVLNEFVTRLEFLEEYVKIIEGNYQYHITLLVSILGFVIAAAGASLYFLAKSLVNSKVDEQLEKRIETLKKETFEDMKNIVFQNPQLLVYQLKVNVLHHSGKNYFVNFGINLNGEYTENEISLDFSGLWKFYSPLSDKYFDFTAQIGKDRTFIVYLRDFNLEKDGNELTCQVIMENKRYTSYKYK